MTNTYLPYFFTEAYCIVYATTILIRLNSNIGSEHEVRELRYMIYAYLGMLASDMMWALFEDGTIVPSYAVNITVNAVTIMSITLGCYFWYRFIDTRLHPKRQRSRKHKILLAIPIMCICLIDVISVFTGWIFYINDKGHYDIGSLFWLQTVVNYYYLLIPTVMSIYKAVRARSRDDRAEYIMYAAYMVAPLSAGMLEDVVPTVPILALNIFMIIHVLFVMIQNRQIYNDALTELNNRRRLNQFLDDRLPKANEENPLAVFILDINGFKAINDKHGHVEGDNALRSFASVLKKAATTYGAFIARYGGDEFCLVITDIKKTPEEIAGTVRDMTAADCGAASGAICPFTASIGYTLCTEPEFDTEAVLKKADAMLYKNKQEWHRKND